MNSNRIKEIQAGCAYPNSKSVMSALMQVWNECKQPQPSSSIVTNDRFDRLTNLDISTHYRDEEYYFFSSDFLSALAYWIVAQNPNKQLIDIKPVLLEFQNYIVSKFKDVKMPQKFTYDQLKEIVSDDVFENLPTMLVLNQMVPDFIDLGALARNVFFMMLREQITQH